MKEKILPFIKKYPMSILLAIIAFNMFFIAGSLRKEAETWAVFCYERWTSGEGGTPEQQRDRRNPQWKKSLERFEKRRQQTKLYYY